MDSKTSELFSHKLTPLELKNKEFKRTVWGYSPQEVVDFLDATARVWEQVQRHEKDLMNEIRSLNQELALWKSRQTELDTLREKAREEAKQIREQATTEAEKMLMEVQERAEDIRAKTEEWLAGVISEIEETDRRKELFLNGLKTTLDQHYQLLERERETVKPLESQLHEFLSEDRKAKPGAKPKTTPTNLN